MSTSSSPGDTHPPRSSRTTFDAAKKYWWVGAVLVPVLVALIGVMPSLVGGSSGGNTYITNSRIGGDLYFTSNVQLEDPMARAQFDEAVAFARDGRYAEAKALFEQLAPVARSAGVYNNLGVVNAALGDDAAAQRSVTQALELEPENEGARQNLDLLARAVKQQASNNTILTAAPIQLGAGIESSLASAEDSDFFSFTAPAGQRDVLRLQMENRSTTFAPQVAVFDSARVQLATDYRTTPGASTALDFVVVPGATYYAQVKPWTGSGGIYSMSIQPQKAFDRFEPNDDILNPSEVRTGQDIEAGIMDGMDHDVFRVAVAPGPLRVSLANRSSGLAPDVFLFDDNKSQDKRQYNVTPGANVSLESTVTRPGVWFVRVSPWSGTGQYTLRIEQ